MNQDEEQKPFTPADLPKLLAALKADIKAAEPLKLENDQKVAQWRAEFDGRPYGNEVKGRSSIVSRDIKKQLDWQHASLVDPFVSTPEIVRCLPVTHEDTLAARQNELVLNTQFCRQFPRYNFISKAVKVLAREGTLIVQTGWDYEEKRETVNADTLITDEFGNEHIVVEEVEQVTVVKNQPTARICRSEDVYIDPTCQDDPSNAQFVVYRYETDLSTLRKDGRYKNLVKVAKTCADVSDYTSPDTTDFKFSDVPRKKQLVYEYWGNYDLNGDGIAEAIVCAWIGEVCIRLEENPYPDQKPPFLIVPYNSVPFKPHGEADAETIGVNQKIKTALLRGIMDNMARSNNGQVGLRKGAMDAVNRARFLEGKNFEFNGSPNDFWQGSYNSIPGSVFDVIGMMNSEVESLTGTQGFHGGISGKSLGNSATAARGALDATAVRRMDIVRNISENLVKPLLRKWMSYNAVFMEEEEVIRITNDEHVAVRRDDLKGLIDIDITIATAEDNANKAEELSFLLQTLGPSEDPSIRRELMAEIMELMRMPEAARKMREFEPQPDPMQEKLHELELLRLQKEISLIDYKAAELNARAGKLGADAAFTEARTVTEGVKADKMESERDLQDLEFLRRDEGIELQHKEALAEKKRLHDLDVIALQLMNGDNNAGVPRR